MKLNLVRTLCKWEKDRKLRIKQEWEFKGLDNTHFDIAELHIPFTIYKHFIDMAEETRKLKGKYKILVCPGDSINLDMLSYFYKTSPEHSKPIDEINKLIEIMKYAHEVYDDIIFLEANHENRMKKILLKLADGKEQAEAVWQLINTLENRFISNRLDKINYINGYFFQLCDTCLCHFEKNSNVVGKSMTLVIDYLNSMLKRPFNAVYQAHTHKMSKICYRRKIGIETGALCAALDYARDGSIKYGSNPISIGYAVGDIYDNKIDINSCNFIVKEWEGWL